MTKDELFAKPELWQLFCNPELSDQVTKSLSPSRKSHTTRSIECKRNWAVEARKPDLNWDAWQDVVKVESGSTSGSTS